MNPMLSKSTTENTGLHEMFLAVDQMAFFEVCMATPVIIPGCM
jgi:hypothetical protein